MTRRLCRFSPQDWRDRIFCPSKSEEELTDQHCIACGGIRSVVRLNKIHKDLDKIVTKLDTLIKEMPTV